MAGYSAAAKYPGIATLRFASANRPNSVPACKFLPAGETTLPLHFSVEGPAGYGATASHPGEPPTHALLPSGTQPGKTGSVRLNPAPLHGHKQAGDRRCCRTVRPGPLIGLGLGIQGLEYMARRPVTARVRVPPSA